jgi:hypothetical protein
MKTRQSLLLMLLLAGTAFAAAKPKVVVDAPAPVKALLTAALKKKFTPVPSKKPMSEDPGAGEVKQTVRDAGGIAVVTARVNNGVWTVMVLNGADGSPLEQFRFNAPAKKKPLKALPKGTDARLAKALADARAPGKESKKPEPEPEPEKAPEPEPVAEPVKRAEPVREVREVRDEPRRSRREEPVEVVKSDDEAVPEPTPREKPPALRAGVGGRAFTRRFFYKADIRNALSKYSLPIGPAALIEADWFPAAHFMKGPATSIGLSFGLSYAFGINSVASDKTSYGTSANRVRIGLIGRFEFGRIELQPQLGWALQTYSIAVGAMGASKPNIPDVAYSAIRFGLGTRIKVAGPLSISAGFAYDLPLSTGEIGSKAYFPRASVGGLDTNLGLVVGVTPSIELRVGIDYIRYWYSMNPEIGDPYIAGGALDDYRGANAMVAFTL